MTQPSASPCLDIIRIHQLQDKPAPYSPGEEHFWTDPHIARQMLAAHIDPGTDAASRRPETIQRSVGWIVEPWGWNPAVLPFKACGAT